MRKQQQLSIEYERLRNQTSEFDIARHLTSFIKDTAEEKLFNLQRVSLKLRSIKNSIGRNVRYPKDYEKLHRKLSSLENKNKMILIVLEDHASLIQAGLSMVLVDVDGNVMRLLVAWGENIRLLTGIVAPACYTITGVRIKCVTSEENSWIKENELLAEKSFEVIVPK